VQSTSSNALQVAADGQVQWASDGAPAKVSGGRLGALLEQRDVVLPRLMADLDSLAADLIQTVNAVHSAGFGLDDGGPAAPGRAFFAGTGAADIAVDAAGAANPRNIAASSRPGVQGDGSQALVLAEALQDADISGRYRAYVGRLGWEVRRAGDAVEVQVALVGRLQQRREALSGVSLDEETVNLLKYQQAYAASARVATAVDQMLEVLINQMGVVGR
jgi:flagellar hook-associated protein 1 FlgK